MFRAGHRMHVENKSSAVYIDEVVSQSDEETENFRIINFTIVKALNVHLN